MAPTEQKDFESQENSLQEEDASYSFLIAVVLILGLICAFIFL